MTAKDVHDARKLRDVERDEPGVTKAALDGMLAAHALRWERRGRAAATAETAAELRSLRQTAETAPNPDGPLFPGTVLPD